MASACGNDMPYEQAYEYAIGLAHHSSASFLEPLTQAAYADVPVSYVLCEQDLVVVPDAQKGFIKVLEEGSGKEVRVVKLQSGHCPNWSRPEELAGVLGELAVGE
jgi:pimeloyl-ACP methyl ester carboxylesterase